jgi:maltooligosyltrehalose trehalohydrolase
MTDAVWSLQRGATVVDGGVRFSVWAPAVSAVAVRLFDADGRPTAEHALADHGKGVFEATVPGVAAGADYAFVLAGDAGVGGALGDAVPDPVSRWQPRGVHGPSRVVDPRAFHWADAEWRGLEMADLVLYEVHVGTFSPEGTFEGAIPYLHELRDLGVTAIELMPVAEFPGRRNWGYDGVHAYAAQSSYGGPTGLRRLVDAAHRRGLAVFLDVVYNHTGPEGSVLHRYGPYFTERYHTPWGRGFNTDGPDSDEVRRYFVDNALHWVTDYHVDGLRFDATDQIFDSSPAHLLEEIVGAVHAQAAQLGRRALCVAETEANDPRWLRGADCGGFGFDGQWNDDFHHAVRVALTGEARGYYADFDGVPSVAKALRHRFVYNGDYSAYRRRRRGRSADAFARDRFVVFVQNHDQVGNRAEGERLSALATFAQCKLAAAALLLSPSVPLLFMGEEYGERRPFLYFVEHGDPGLVEAVRAGRRSEFEAFGWAEAVPDPQDEDTFLRSKLDRARRACPEQAATLRLYGDLLALRAAEPLLRPGVPAVEVAHDADGGWVVAGYATEGDGAARGGGGSGGGGVGEPLALLLNFSPEARDVPLRPPAVPPGRWRCVLSTDDARYGGAHGVTAAAAVPDDVRAAGGLVTLPAHAAALFKREAFR